VDGSANGGEAVIVDGRIGITWGADALWGDVRGSTDEAIEAAIHDCLNDADAWEARN